MLSGILLFGCSAIGIREGTEEPRYTVLAVPNGLEIRQYGPRIAAETTVAGEDELAALNDGFRRIAGYIFGANRTKAKIDMTVPVAQQKGQTIAMTAPVGQARGADGQWVVRFFMPAEWTLATLPVPDNPAVVLVPVPGETMAVLRFTGLRWESTIAARQAEPAATARLDRLEAGRGTARLVLRPALDDPLPAPQRGGRAGGAALNRPG